MNFTITIQGESSELTGALRALKTILDGQAISSGEVTATVAQQAGAQAASPAIPIAGDQAPTPAATAAQQPQQPPAAPVTPTPAQAPAPAPTAVPTAAPTTSSAPAAVPTAAPTAVPQYDFNQLATATMQLQQAGQNIFEIFGQFGIQALNQLPKERYAEYAAVLRERGAKI